MRKIPTINEMQEIATDRGGNCLSGKYINAKEKLLWECAKGHQWKASPDTVKRGSWCPKCSFGKGGRKPLSIEEMKKIARERGGECLSNNYLNSSTKLLWKCAEGHQWKATPSSVKKRSWCPACAGRPKLYIENMHELAEKRGGRCISVIYKNARSKLTWECAEGHQWEAVPDKVKRGSWCPFCSGNVGKTLSDLQDVARTRGGKCLSKNYKNNNTRLQWECSEGHRWKAVFGSIQQGSWCPVCADSRKGDSQRSSIESMHELAEKRGGKCLAETYINNHTKLLWECAEGHQWEATPGHIGSGQWCPVCSAGLGERICRSLFEQIFERSFPKAFPDWLINTRGNQMELDGYCEKLGLAFEHHGTQHYEESRFFHRSVDQFEQRQLDDKTKADLCELNGVCLIEIPELFTLLKVDDFPEYLLNKLSESNIQFPESAYEKVFDYSDAYRSAGASNVLNEMKSIASSRGGRCLSEAYVNNSTKLKWQCAEGHQWEAVSYSVRVGTWCPHCAGNLLGSIEEMQGIAEARGGKCLSKKYKKSITALRWECKSGHKWNAAPSSVKNGTWCPVCAGIIKGNIEQMQELAEVRGGKCLSEAYINNRIKLKWQCAEGHQWEAAPGKVKRGTWCPACSHKRIAAGQRLSIEEMREIAKTKNGECLSNTYTNAHTKLIWRCSKGHEWKTAPMKIKKGAWCPACAIENRKNNAY